jgi:hypothetical protein
MTNQTEPKTITDKQLIQTLFDANKELSNIHYGFF